jgi:membrane protease YdiL (CAAX protease family)
LRTLFVSHINFHIKLRWLLFIFLVPAGVSTLSCLIFELFGGSLPKFQIEPLFIPAAFVYVLIFLGPLGEEAGWRGFALKRLLTELSPIKAALLLGAVWSVWHLPLFFIDGTTQHKLTDFGLPAALACYLVYTVMISILITLVYVMTDENTLTALLFHAAANLSLGVVPLIFIKSGAVILLLVLGGTTAGFTYAYKKILFCEDLHGHSDN